MKLDYLHGQKVEEATVDANTDPEWFIRFESGYVITNKDETLEGPLLDVKGLALVDSVENGATTVLTFANVTADSVIQQAVEIDLTTDKYTLAGPGTEEVYPGVPVDEADTLPPDPSSDRVVDGPETP